MFKYKNLYFRPVEEKDLEKARKMRNDPSTWMNLTDIDLIEPHAQKEWLKTLSKQRRVKRYYTVGSSKHSFLGLIRMDEFDWTNRSVRVGLDISQRLRGKGYGTLVMEMIVHYCFNFLNMHRLWLLVLDVNRAARRVYQKVGFTEEGCYREAIFRDGRYHDYILMSLLKKEAK